MKESFAIQFTDYFKFNSAHFVVYKGFREPLHGHNYKISLKLTSAKLNDEGNVFDSDILIEIMNTITGNLKHRLLIPKYSNYLKISEEENNYKLKCEDSSEFSIPNSDVRLVEIENVTAECLAKFVALELLNKLKGKYIEELKTVQAQRLVIKISEDLGKQGNYSLNISNI